MGELPFRRSPTPPIFWGKGVPKKDFGDFLGSPKTQTTFFWFFKTPVRRGGDTLNIHSCRTQDKNYIS